MKPGIDLADGRVLAEGRGEDGLVVADVDLDRVRAMRRAVPIGKDERVDVYRGWSPSPERGSQ